MQHIMGLLMKARCSSGGQKKDDRKALQLTRSC
jgi:hypothetical protein